MLPGIAACFPTQATLARIEEHLAPLLGETMARASVRAQAEKIGLDAEQIEPPKIDALLDALGKGMRVFIGAKRTREVLDGLIDSLGEEGPA